MIQKNVQMCIKFRNGYTFSFIISVFYLHFDDICNRLINLKNTDYERFYNAIK